MTSSKCLIRRVISRAGSGAVLLVLLSARLLAAQSTILPKDAAVREYELGLEALKKKDFRVAIERLNAALATGHTRADEGFGTSRYPLEWYDPYYWLGVAHMELGEDDQARRFFRLSREGGVIERRAEYADLLERTRILDAHETAHRLPSPTPVFAVPTPPPPPRPTPFSAPARREPAGAARPTPETRESVRPDAPSFVPLITAIAQGRFEDADAELEQLRRAVPESAELELLAAVLYGSRYVLEGSVDRSLLARARKSLESFRRRGGSLRAEEAWLSPSLRALLGG